MQCMSFKNTEQWLWGMNRSNEPIHYNDSDFSLTQRVKYIWSIPKRNIKIISPFALQVFGGSADSCDASRWRNVIGCYFITQKEERIRTVNGLRGAHLFSLRWRETGAELVLKYSENWGDTHLNDTEWLKSKLLKITFVKLNKAEIK